MSSDNYTEKYINTLENFILTYLLLIIVCVMLISVILIWIGYEKSDTHLIYFLILEFGKALFITALITVPVRWFLIKQSEKTSYEKNKLIIDNIHTKNSEFKNDIESRFDEHDSKVVSKLDSYNNSIHEKISSHDFSLNEIIQSHDDTIKEGMKIYYELVSNEISKIASNSLTLSALDKVNIGRVYEKRTDAGEDIKKVLMSPDVENIQLIGISLNDITRDENPIFHEIWLILEGLITGSKPIDSDRFLNIKILLIDPASEGACLRAEAEEREGQKSRLYRDVHASMQKLKIAQENNVVQNVNFEVKLYRTPPILFMIRTQCVSFIQHYYFRPSHESNVPIPLLRYQQPPIPDKRSVHGELNEHFQWIWDKASISVDEYIEEFSRGTFRACYSSSINNMYLEERIRDIEDQDESRRSRINYIIKNTKHRLWIKGITLHRYFMLGSDLFSSIKKVCQKKEVDIRILLINPESCQAKMRSFREYLLSHKSASFDSFDDKERQRERLYRELLTTVGNIKNNLIPHIPDSNIENIKFACYDACPESFLLITDEYAMIEQYHYGQIIEEENVLGGNAPIIEYKKGVNSMYDVLEDHFNYVYEYCSLESTFLNL